VLATGHVDEIKSPDGVAEGKAWFKPLSENPRLFNISTN